MGKGKNDSFFPTKGFSQQWREGHPKLSYLTLWSRPLSSSEFCNQILFFIPLIRQKIENGRMQGYPALFGPAEDSLAR